MFGDFVEEPGSFVHSVLANVNMLFLTFIRSASVNNITNSERQWKMTK